MNIRDFVNSPNRDTPNHILRTTLENNYYNLDDNFGSIVRGISGGTLRPILETANVPDGLINGLFAKADEYERTQGTFLFIFLYFSFCICSFFLCVCVRCPA